MNVGKLGNSEAAGILGLGILAIIVVYIVGKKTVTAVANVNQGTPYEGYGAVGTVGHAADAASGGTLSSIGNWLGGSLYSLVNGEYDPNAVGSDSSTPIVAPGTLSNPVKASPTILPNSYKQSVIDIPSLLGSDAVFTPSAAGGASGSWADDGNSVTGGGLDTGGYDGFGD